MRRQSSIFVILIVIVTLFLQVFPAGADFGPLIFRSALSGPADAMLIDEVPEGGTAEVNYIYYLTEEDVAAGTVTEYVTIQPAEASRLVGSVLRLSVFD